MITGFGNFYEQFPQRRKTQSDETRAAKSSQSDHKRMNAARLIELLKMAEEFGISKEELGL